jgi:SH3 domain-containing YSC84-like protein 1
MIKGAFIFGGKHGRGLSTCRLPDGRWSAPAFLTVTGGRWGTQIGVEDIQLVMVIMNDDGMRSLLSNKFQIGAGASAAAGPVGRHDLDGSWIEHDKDSTVAIYGQDYSTTEVLTGKVPVPDDARQFFAEVRKAEARAMTSQADTT